MKTGSQKTEFSPAVPGAVPPLERKVFLLGGVIDGSGAAMRRRVALSVRGGFITAIGPAEGLSERERTELIDLSHCIALPALVDCSLRLSQSPSVDSSVRQAAAAGSAAEKTALLQGHIRDCHVHGVLGVAAGDDLSAIAAEPGRQLAGLVEFRNSGSLMRDGHEVVTAPADGDFVRVIFGKEVDALDCPLPGSDREGLARIFARKEGKKVVVANGRRAVGEALSAGCDAIEQGYEMGEDNLRRMADTGVLWIPSVLRAKNALDGSRSGGEVCCRFSTRYVAPGQPLPGVEAYWEKMLAGQLAQLRLARHFGVETAVGTGAGNPGILHGEAMAEEIKLFLKAGYLAEEAICAATENGASFFGMNKLGRLVPGKAATFLVVRGTLPQLPRKLSYLEGIYLDGTPSGVYRKNPVKSG